MSACLWGVSGYDRLSPLRAYICLSNVLNGCFCGPLRFLFRFSFQTSCQSVSQFRLQCLLDVLSWDSQIVQVVQLSLVCSSVWGQSNNNHQIDLVWHQGFCCIVSTRCQQFKEFKSCVAAWVKWCHFHCRLRQRTNIRVWNVNTNLILLPMKGLDIGLRRSYHHSPRGAVKRGAAHCGSRATGSEPHLGALIHCSAWVIMDSSAVDGRPPGDPWESTLRNIAERWQLASRRIHYRGRCREMLQSASVLRLVLSFTWLRGAL